MLSTDELFNDPNYGFVLCFLEKFRTILNLPKYPAQLLEKHLIDSQQRQVPRRLIDFHFLLLKRLSRAKNARRENFEAILSRFVARFDSNDSQRITTHGYLQADVHLKLRILKNLLESQFDFNHQFQKTFLNKPPNEINPSPIGRDRFGVSYWLFIDDSYVRLFREDVDFNRTWTIICRTRDELDRFIKLLLSDSVFQTKFQGNSIFEQSFCSKVFPSNEFEQCYPPVSLTIIDNEESISKSSRSRKRLRTLSTDEDDVCLAQRCSTRIRNSTKKPRPSRRRRRKRSSSSDEQTDYDTSSNDDNDYLSEEIIFDDEEPSSEPIQTARTAQTLTIVPNCFVCQSNNHPEVLLLCDDCNDAYHIECLHPNLLAIPNSHWFCPLCEQKQLITNLISKYQQKQIVRRKKIKIKQYSSDESLTAMESEDEELTVSSMHDDDDQQITEFSLQLPKQITRLIHRCDRANVKCEQQVKSSSIKFNNSDSNESIELNEKLGSPLVYVDSDGPVRQMKSVVTNSKQTSKIVRRWNDVQRRSRLKANLMKNSLATDDLTDENSNFPIDDLSTINSNHFEIKIDEEQLNKFTNSILPSKNLVKKLDANFDRLTRDIQGAITHANVSSTKSTDQQSNKRNSKKFFSPFVCKTIAPINISDNRSNIF